MSEVSGCACLNLRKAARAITQAYDTELRPTGLRATQFSLLATLATLEPATMGGLADRLAMDRTTLSRNLGPLQRRGLVTSRKGKDSRVRELSLTADGRAALEGAIPVWRRAQAQFAHMVGETEFKRLLSGLGATQAAYRADQAPP